MQHHRGRIIYFPLKNNIFVGCYLFCEMLYKNDMYGKKIISKIFDLKIHGIPP